MDKTQIKALEYLKKEYQSQGLDGAIYWFYKDDITDSGLDEKQTIEVLREFLNFVENFDLLVN